MMMHSPFFSFVFVLITTSKIFDVVNAEDLGVGGSAPAPVSSGRTYNTVPSQWSPTGAPITASPTDSPSTTPSSFPSTYPSSAPTMCEGIGINLFNAETGSCIDEWKEHNDGEINMSWGDDFYVEVNTPDCAAGTFEYPLTLEMQYVNGTTIISHTCTDPSGACMFYDNTTAVPELSVPGEYLMYLKDSASEPETYSYTFNVIECILDWKTKFALCDGSTGARIPGVTVENGGTYEVCQKSKPSVSANDVFEFSLELSTTGVEDAVHLTLEDSVGNALKFVEDSSKPFMVSETQITELSSPGYFTLKASIPAGVAVGKKKATKARNSELKFQMIACTDAATERQLRGGGGGMVAGGGAVQSTM